MLKAFWIAAEGPTADTYLKERGYKRGTGTYQLKGLFKRNFPRGINSFSLKGLYLIYI